MLEPTLFTSFALFVVVELEANFVVEFLESRVSVSVRSFVSEGAKRISPQARARGILELKFSDQLIDLSGCHRRFRILVKYVYCIRNSSKQIAFDTEHRCVRFVVRYFRWEYLWYF